MKLSIHRIYTSDGLELFGLLYEPDSVTSTVLVHVHGMGGNFYENSFLDAVAVTLTSAGIAFFVFNNRGCELFKDLTKVTNSKKSLVRMGNAYEKFEECVFDVGAAIDAVSARGFTDIHLSGHSLGSPKVAYYLVQTNDVRIQSVLFLSPADMLGLERQNRGRFDKNLKEARDMTAMGKGEELLSEEIWDEYPISAATYLSLFADESKAGIFNFYNPSDELEQLQRITQPVVVIMGRKDDVLTVSIEETMERTTKALKNSAHVETKILGDANHGYYGDEENLANAILAWVRR